MYIQIINFHLKNVTEEQYAKLCDQLAPAFAKVPGLLEKTWLANPATNTYGGVYMWRDREAMIDFTKTDLFKGVATHQNLDAITSTDFDVMEGPTRMTRGLMQAAA